MQAINIQNWIKYVEIFKKLLSNCFSFLPPSILLTFLCFFHNHESSYIT
jgi:hypothetical protein